MAEYIEREAIKYEQWAVGPLNAPLMVVRKKTIDSIPAADVAPVKHGRWEEIKEWDFKARDYFNAGYHCSCCGQWYFRPQDSIKYCPNCGAKMDGE